MVGGALPPPTPPPASAPLAPMPGPWAGTPSLKVDLVRGGGLLEDLVPILEFLGVMVSTYHLKALEKPGRFIYSKFKNHGK